MIKKGVLKEYNGTLDRAVIPSGVTKIDKNAFFLCYLNTEVVIPESVTEIAPKAFMNSSALDGIVVIPSAVRDIGERTFYGCTSLGGIVLPHGLTSIGDQAFGYCASLREITVPDTVSHVGKAAFTSCRNLKSFKVGEGNPSLRTVDGSLYSKDGSSLIAYAIGKKEAEPRIPDGVTKICEEAFAECGALTRISIPDSVTEIEDGAFKRCDSLTAVTLPKGLKRISACMLASSAIEELDVPNGVETVGEKAFAHCKQLKRLTLPRTVRRIERNAFIGCGSGDLELRLSPDNKAFKLTDGILYSHSGKRAVTHSPKALPTELVIPEGVTRIESGAFCGAKRLVRAVIPRGVTYIGDDAFDSCEALRETVLPSTLKEIGDGAFYGCKSLTEINIPENVTKLGSCAFAECESLTRVTLPDGLKRVGNEPFEWCYSLTEIHVNMKKSYLLIKKRDPYTVLLAIIRGAVERYGRGKLTADEEPILSELISDSLYGLMEQYNGYTPFIRYVTDKKLLDTDTASESLSNGSLPSESRAILLDYIERHGKSPRFDKKYTL